jgi:hypothetical protein
MRKDIRIGLISGIIDIIGFLCLIPSILLFVSMYFSHTTINLLKCVAASIFLSLGMAFSIFAERFWMRNI